VRIDYVRTLCGALGVLLCGAGVAAAQAPVRQALDAALTDRGIVPEAIPVLPDEYVIGPDDVLSIVFWHEKDMSVEAVVRPDGKISLPLLNEVDATGLTPSALRDRLAEEARRYVEDPNVTVVVRQINSRKVYVTGEVGRPGVYPLNGQMTVLQLLALAGGLREYADSKNILVVRAENGRRIHFTFNYEDVSRGRRLTQNLELRPGDTIVVR
jgi:polysaccharide export outer membrane protein